MVSACRIHGRCLCVIPPGKYCSKVVQCHLPATAHTDASTFIVTDFNVSQSVRLSDAMHGTGFCVFGGMYRRAQSIAVRESPILGLGAKWRHERPVCATVNVYYSMSFERIVCHLAPQHDVSIYRLREPDGYTTDPRDGTVCV